MKFIKPVVFALLGLAAGVFLVLGSRQNKPDAPPGFTMVEYWEKWNGPEFLGMKAIVDDFNNTVGWQKKIFVRYMSMSEIDRKTLMSVAAGVPPDIAGIWDQQVAQYAAIGAAEPLDDLAKAHGITRDYYLPVFWDGCSYKGHLYALVSTPGTVGLIYNKQIYEQCGEKLKAAGLDPERAPRTLEEFDRYSEILDERDADGNIERAGFIPLQSWYVPHLGFWFGADIVDPATGRPELDSPEMIQAFTWIQGYAKRLGERALNDFKNSLGNFDSPQNPFLEGKEVMDQQGPWMANYIRNNKPEFSEVLVPLDRQWELKDRRANCVWGVAPFPSAVAGKELVSYNSFDGLMIPTGARHPKEAFEFIAYVNRQDVSEKLNTLHCKNCQLRQVSAGFLEHHPNPYIAIFQELAAGPNAHCVPVSPIWAEMYQELVDTSQAVSLEPVDAAEAMHRAQARMMARYDRFNSIQQQREQLGIN
jgi:ABC-type glycerol-3-phosphate transport system substrate-binding protein